MRFRDPQLGRDSFIDTVLVRCPRCAGVAHVVQGPAPTRAVEGPVVSARHRLVCRGCGLSRQSEKKGVSFRFRWGPEGPTDPYVEVPLWLLAETRHGRLWAYNLEHLDLIRRFVRAPLRERAPWYEPGRKMTLVARLPAWVKRAKNRTEVLRVIDRMRASVPN
ncbi:hypothetical protein [Streptomyces sp. URMC 123]|uniref:hypothetical protein n=1 Tax=Streptomyces sp. URMC 123 TaxID=3423403 RepID=UPI003F1DF8DA